MFVGICKIKLDLSYSHSLKEKRSALQRIKQKGMTRFKILIAEVEDQDLLQSAALGFALVGHDPDKLYSVIHKMLDYIEASEGCRIADEKIEVFQYP